MISPKVSDEEAEKIVRRRGASWVGSPALPSPAAPPTAPHPAAGGLHAQARLVRC